MPTLTRAQHAVYALVIDALASEIESTLPSPHLRGLLMGAAVAYDGDVTMPYDLVHRQLQFAAHMTSDSLSSNAVRNAEQPLQTVRQRFAGLIDDVPLREFVLAVDITAHYQL